VSYDVDGKLCTVGCSRLPKIKQKRKVAFLSTQSGDFETLRSFLVLDTRKTRLSLTLCKLQNHNAKPNSKKPNSKKQKMISRHPLPPRPTTVDSRDSNTLQQRWKWWYDKRVESNAKKGMGGGEWEGGLSVVYEVGTVNIHCK